MNVGLGGIIYPNYTPFAFDSVMKHLGLYIFNRISPSTQVEMKFHLKKVNEANVNDLIHEVFLRRSSGRHKEFKDFFATVDPVLKTTPRAIHPNWKIATFFRHANMYL